MTPPLQMLVEVARSFIGIHEEGADNRGPMVDRFERAVGPEVVGEPWCAAFICFCVKEVERRAGLKSNLFRTSGCVEMWKRTPPLLRRGYPAPGLIVLWQRFGTDRGHCGIVVGLRSPGVFMTVEGNTTNGHEIEREGDGVYLKERTVQGTQLFVPLGFLQPF